MTSFNPTQPEDLLWRVVTSVAHQSSWAALAWVSVTSSNIFFPSNIGNVCSWRTSRGIHFKAQLGMEVFISGSQVCEKKSIIWVGVKKVGPGRRKSGSQPRVRQFAFYGIYPYPWMHSVFGSDHFRRARHCSPGTFLGYNPIPHLHQWET